MVTSRYGVPSMHWRFNSLKVAVLLCVSVALLSGASPTGAQGKGQGVEVLALTPKVVETEPGQIVSASFSVRSFTAQPEEFAESLSMPADWQAVVQPTSFPLDPQQAVVRLVAFLVPGNTAAGSYRITYSVMSRRDYGIRDSDTITIVVRPVARLELLLEEKPDSVIAGETYQISFRVINRSNSTLMVTIRATSSQGNSLKLDTDVFEPPVGGTRLITATVSTNGKLRRRVSDVISIQAVGVGIGNEVITTGLTVPVDLIPRAGEDADTYHRIPSEISILSAGGGDDRGAQIEFSGQGSIDEAGVRTIDFLFRGPDIQDTSFFGLRDEYRLNYSTPELDLRLGDQSYGLSQLTDYYRYGRGAGFNYRRGRTHSGAYFVEDRWGMSERQQMGFYLGSESRSGSGIRVNMLTRNGRGFDGFDDNILSLQGTTKPFAGSNLELELGTCSSNRADAGNGAAWRMRLDGRGGDVNYSLGAIHASPDYFGYYNDADYSNASLTFPVAERLRGHASAQRWRRNLDRDDDQADAPLEKTWQVGLDYDLTRSTRLSLGSVFFSRQDLLEPADFDYEERATRLGIGRTFRTSSLQFYWDLGRQHDLLADGGSRNVSRYALYYHLRAGHRQHISLYSLFGDRSGDGSRLLGGSNTVGASVSLRPSDRLSLSLNYSTNEFRMDADRDNRQFYATVVYHDPSERVWAVRLRNSDRTLTSDTSFLLSCTIPFGIPVARRKNVGSIHGRIFDAESPEGQGVPRVIVHANGSTAVTDEKGEFTLRTLSSGPWHLSVDRGSIGLDRVTDARLPMVVDVEQGMTSEVRIGLIRSARVHAMVSLFEFKSLDSDRSDGSTVFVGSPDRSGGVVGGNGAPVEAGGLRDVLLEFTNGEETLRAATDGNGEFTLADMRPGVWAVKVYDHNLPALHYLEQPEFSIELKPGDEVSLPIKVLPRLRQIQIIEHDTIR